MQSKKGYQVKIKQIDYAGAIAISDVRWIGWASKMGEKYVFRASQTTNHIIDVPKWRMEHFSNDT